MTFLGTIAKDDLGRNTTSGGIIILVVEIFIWRPTSVAMMVEHGIVPDLGHAAIQVTEGPETLAYVSFWPEIESVLGQVTLFFKPRDTRHPSSYLQECDPMDGFMQRPADYIDTVPHLDEGNIIRGWQRLKTAGYDFLQWNCSNVVKFLIIRAMSMEDQDKLRQFIGSSENILDEINGDTDDDDSLDSEESLLSLTTRLRKLALTDFIECIPEDLIGLVDALKECRSA